MKTYFKNLIQAYQGKCDGLVYYYNPRLKRFVARQHVIPRASESNRRLAAIARNLKALDLADGYKGDFKVYTGLFNRKSATDRGQFNNWYNAFTKMMWSLAARHAADPALPDLDLETLTRDEIYGQDLPCVSVKRAVEAGLLEPVTGSELLSRTL